MDFKLYNSFRIIMGGILRSLYWDVNRIALGRVDGFDIVFSNRTKSKIPMLMALVGIGIGIRKSGF